MRTEWVKKIIVDTLFFSGHPRVGGGKYDSAPSCEEDLPF